MANDETGEAKAIEVKAGVIEAVPLRPMVQRTLSVERTYALAQFQNLKLFDAITNLPPEVLRDPELLGRLRYLQFIQLELAYRNYIKLSEELFPYNLEEQIGLLEEMKLNTMEEIRSLFEKGE